MGYSADRENQIMRGECVISSNSIKNIFGTLDQSGWLSEQPEEFKRWAISVARSKTLRDGKYLYHAGDTPKGIYGVKSGSLEIEFPLVAEASEMVSFLRTSEGFWIGDAALLSRTNRIISIVSVGDCDLVFFPARAIKKLLAEQPHHWSSFYELIARNTLTVVRLLAESLSLTVKARVCRMLISLSENRLEAQITQDSLAKMLGIARPTLRRCLLDLTATSAIEVGYGKIRILNKTVLEHYKDEQ